MCELANKPVYPSEQIVEYIDENDEQASQKVTTSGMTLREYYTGQIMVGFLKDQHHPNWKAMIAETAKSAVIAADAIIAELEKSDG